MPKAAERAGGRRKVNSILSRREQLVAEVARLREQHNSSKLVENAQQLLTRTWAAADWDAREDLLKTVDWLVRAEKRRDCHLPASMQLQVSLQDSQHGPR